MLTLERYMSSAPVTVGKDQTMDVAHDLMRKHRIRHLPVLDGGRVVGMVTERDLHLMETLRDVNPADVRVEDAMSAEPYCVRTDDELADVATHMAEHRLGSAVVVQGDRPIGVFTAVDALRALGDALRQINQIAQRVNR